MEFLYNLRQVIVVRKDLNMRKGKIAAQVAHASNTPLVELNKLMEKYYIMQLSDCKYKDLESTAEKYQSFKSNIDLWWNSGHTKIVLGCNSEKELLSLIEKAEKLGIPCYPVYDLGLTEFHGQETLTCCSFGPAEKEELDPITGKLQLI